MNAKNKILVLFVLVLLAVPLIMGPTKIAVENPLTASLYQLEIQGKTIGYFTQASGMGSSSDVVEQRVSGSSGKEIYQQIPSRVKFNKITLKRGLSGDMSMWDWRQLVVDGKISEARSSGFIIMLDQNSRQAAKWEFTNAWPSEITFNSDSSTNIGIEETTLVCEDLKRVSL